MLFNPNLSVSLSHTWATNSVLFYKLGIVRELCLWLRSWSPVIFILYCKWLEVAASIKLMVSCVEVLAGTSEGACRCCGNEWSCGIVLSGNSSLRWRRGRRASGLNLEINLPCLHWFLSFSLVFNILHVHILHIFIYDWYLLVLNCYTSFGCLISSIIIIVHSLHVFWYWFVCSHLYLTKRAIVAPQLLI